jgi:lysophospholipase L1-like esterase
MASVVESDEEDRLRRLKPGYDRLETRDCPSFGAPQYLAGLPPLGAIPVERTDPTAVRQHLLDVQRAATGRYPVVFLGDSITNYWATLGGAPVWRKSLAPLGAAAFGVPEDLAQDLLWRVENGELAGHPKVAVVEVGTNNLGVGDSVSDTVTAITGVVDAIEAISPSTKILLLGLLPRGASPSDPLRAQVAAVNAQLADLADGSRVRYLDLGPAVTLPGGVITPNFLAPDYIHPNARGYRALTAAIVPTLVSMLNQD